MEKHGNLGALPPTRGTTTPTHCWGIRPLFEVGAQRGEGSTCRVPTPPAIWGEVAFPEARLGCSAPFLGGPCWHAAGPHAGLRCLAAASHKSTIQELLGEPPLCLPSSSSEVFTGATLQRNLCYRNGGTGAAAPGAALFLAVGGWQPQPGRLQGFFIFECDV